MIEKQGIELSAHTAKSVLRLLWRFGREAAAKSTIAFFQVLISVHSENHAYMRMCMRVRVCALEHVVACVSHGQGVLGVSTIAFFTGIFMSHVLQNSVRVHERSQMRVSLPTVDY